MIRTALLALALAVPARSYDKTGVYLATAAKPKIEYQRGPCLGGNRPSTACKTCEWCAYCGKRGPRGKAQRPANSATCVVCAGRSGAAR